MNRGILIICDREEAYARRLMDYLSRKERLFEICIFTELSSMLEYLRSHRTDILLIEKELWEEKVSSATAGKIILLSDGEGVAEDVPYPVIYKLQPAENIEREIMSYYASAGGAVRCLLNTDTKSRVKLWGVFSPVGGCGKTTLSLALGEKLAESKNVLYLNLESFGSLASKGGFKGGMTDLLYYVKERRENLFLLISSLVEKRQGLDCILPADCYSDLLSITKEDIDYLFEELKKSRYDVVIFDAGSITPTTFYLLSGCSRVLLPCRREDESAGKMLSLERNLRMEGYEELFLRMEEVVLPNKQSPEMERFLWKLLQND